MSQPKPAHPAGFTLVELLVVIAIIGILVALLLPAVQSARESARTLQCTNNLKQLALACHAHEDAQGHLPANGIHYRYVGNPNKGFGVTQPGGWHYNILPFIEQSSLRELGLGQTDAEWKETGKQLVGTAVPTFICPTRGAARPFPYTVSAAYQFWNINRPATIARSDYAANSGNRVGGWCNYILWNSNEKQTGVIYAHKVLRAADIRDGLGNTYLIGERYIDPNYYLNGSSGGNDQGWSVGHDFDVFRCTDWSPSNPATSATYAPRRDTPGVNVREMFGSPHAIFHMALCDGSVQSVSYAIAPEIHWRLGNREDGEVIPGGAF